MSFQLPDFTSPPLPEAWDATPVEYQSDEVVDAARQAAAQRQCGHNRGGSSASGTSPQYCQIPFPAATLLTPSDDDSSETSPPPSTGVILYGGALIDPRAYAPLARTLQQRYGLTTVIPIFPKDLAWDYTSCDTGRIALAQQQYPDVDQWILVGHSFGAIAASLDLFQTVGGEDGRGTATIGAAQVSGMVFLAADARNDLGCGSLDFSKSGLPFASLTATNDLRLNKTRWEENKVHLPLDTFYLDIGGGNHGHFGSFNETLRASVLQQWDGPAAIPRQVQQDLAAAAIANVAARAGWEFQPLRDSASQLPHPHGHFRATAMDPATSASWIWTTLVLFVGYFWRGGKFSVVQSLGHAVDWGRNQ